MPIASSAEMYFVCIGVGAAQLLVTLTVYLRARASRTAPGRMMPAAVIIPCKGATEHLARNASSILEQDYPARAEFIFVTASHTDPACAVIAEVLRAHPGMKARLTVSDAVPVHCGEHILNKLYGVSAASQEAEAFVFADSDVRVTRSWLRGMIGPLGDPEVGAVTAPLVFLPGRSIDICRSLRCAWEAVGITYFDLTGCVAGASFSLLKKNFIAFGVQELWKRSISDDLSLTRRIRESGKKVRFAYHVMPTTIENCGFGALLRIFNKWMVYFKFYLLRVWAAGALLTAFKLYAVAWSASGRGWIPTAILFALDSANIYASFRVLRFCLPREFAGSNFAVISLIAAPLLQPLYAVNFITSFFACRIKWGGYTYRLKGPYSISVEPSKHEA